MDPILIEVPREIETPRLLLRAPQAGDGLMLNRAVCDTLDELKPWAAWAQKAPTPEESESVCRRMHADFVLRTALDYFIVLKDGSDTAPRLLGVCNLHNIDWLLRAFELGYWRRKGAGGQGYVSEAVQALTQLAFERFKANRVELRCDERNTASRQVAVRSQFALEGILRRNAFTPDAKLRDTCVFSRLADR